MTTTDLDSAAVTFDLFGTLVTADRPADPARAVATELRDRGVSVPDGFPAAYGRSHGSIPEGRERPLTDHVVAALSACSAGDRADDAGSGHATVDEVPVTARADVEAAVLAAFDRPVRPRDGAERALAAAADRGPVGVCSNCSVPGLVDGALDRAGLDRETLDAVVVSVDCGYRKPDPRIFEAVATELGVDPGGIVHVGDDPGTDGGVESVGGRFLSVAGTSLSELSGMLEGN